MADSIKSNLEIAGQILREIAEEQKRALVERQKERQREEKERQKERQREEKERQKERQREEKERQKERQREEKERQKQAEERQKQAEERQKQAKVQEKMEAKLRKIQEEDRKKTEKSFRKMQRSLDKASGNFTSKWGTFMESLVQGDLLKLMGARGIAVEKILPKVCLGRADKTIAMEFDLIAINGEEVVVVEVKTTLTNGKIDKFIKKLENFKNIFPEYKDKKIYGCVAYLGEHEKSARESEENGLFVIKAPGGVSNIATIINPLDFKPRPF